jgi:hypothetical protein
VTPEQLRRSALEALGPHADERARDVLRRATIVIAHSVRRWVASGGDVEAHRITLAVDAGTLGRVRAVPAIADALCGAIAAAIACRPRETLLELVFRWAPHADVDKHEDRDLRSRSGPLSSSMRDPYRGAPPASTETALGDALVAYLEESGHTAIAAILARSGADGANGSPVVLRVSADAYDELCGMRGAIEAIVRALRDLAGDEKAKVRLNPD